jgi:hypothetical protein
MLHISGASLLVMLSCAIPGWAQKDQAQNPQLTVFVYNRAEVSRVMLEQAERDAVRVFARCDLVIAWVNCPPGVTSPACVQPPATFHATIRLIPRPLTLGEASFGVAFPSDDRGGYADVFFEHVKRLRGDDEHVDLAAVLGHVMAHEIGHLLLGSHSHSPSGIMQDQWHDDQLIKISQGRLLFTAEQAGQMRTHVASWVKSVSSSPDMADIRGQ